MCVSLRAKFEVSSLILTSFRHGDGGSNFTSYIKKRTPKKQIRVNKIVSVLERYFGFKCLY